MQIAKLARPFVRSFSAQLQHNHLRYLNLQASCESTTNAVSKIAKERGPFMDVLPGVIDSVVKNPKISQSPEVSNWVRKLLEYTFAGGQYTRGMIVVLAYTAIEELESITQDSLRMARTLGWCVEMVQSNLKIIDDMMDGSTIRRGKPCWHALPNVGMGAVNDSLIMHCSILETLKTNFSELPLYCDMVDLYNETMLITSSGQHLDYVTSRCRNKSDYSSFTIEQYNSIVKYKTAYCAFKLPIMFGYLLAHNSDKNLHDTVEDVCFDLGKLFQMQDDFFDCYGNELITQQKGTDIQEGNGESITARVGTDIQEGKCSWLAVHALRLSSDAQRELFVHNYADKDPAKVNNIKNLYSELKLQELFTEEKRILYDSILDKINLLPPNHRHLVVTLVALR